jgi:hypothetical protein
MKPVASEHLIIGQINKNRPVRVLNGCSEYIDIYCTHTVIRHIDVYLIYITSRTLPICVSLYTRDLKI